MGIDNVIAFFTAVNAVSVVVLAIITYHYAKSTKKILEESRKARIASERHADIAQEALGVLKQQNEELAGVGRTAIDNAIQVALGRIVHWETLNLENMAYSGELQGSVKLVPSDHQSVMGHAMRMRISDTVISSLSQGFEVLRLAEGDLAAIGGVSEPARRRTYQRHSVLFYQHLNDARGHLETAKDQLEQEN